jgi:hypothetical protein
MYVYVNIWYQLQSERVQDKRQPATLPNPSCTLLDFVLVLLAALEKITQRHTVVYTVVKIQ